MTNRDIPVTDALEYAADIRWQELADGAPFTTVDRLMLAKLRHKATEALATPQASPPVGDDLVEQALNALSVIIQYRLLVVDALGKDDEAVRSAERAFDKAHTALREARAALSTPKVNRECREDCPYRSAQPATRGVDVEVVARAMRGAMKPVDTADGIAFFDIEAGAKAAIASLAPQLDVREALLRRFIEIVDGTDDAGFDPHVEQMLMDLTEEARSTLSNVSLDGEGDE